jgi:hypothetical protein
MALNHMTFKQGDWTYFSSLFCLDNWVHFRVRHH